MLRRFLGAFLSLAALWGILAARQKGSGDPVFAQIDSIVKSLSEITGLSEKHPVPYGRMTKRQLRKFLDKRIKKTLKPDEIYSDELALKMFGLVPQDFDLKRSTIDLLTEQAAAFYDYDEKKLFLLDDSSFTSETTTLAHELSHALADQHFDLDKFMEDTASNDDENLAHTAVVEGQASWLMIAYGLKQAGQAPAPTPEMLESVADSSETSMADYPVLKASPLYIQQSLLFPYTEGTLFFDAVYKKLGKQAFTAVFTDAPVDSAEIIHPSRYFNHQKGTKPELPKLALNKEGKQLTEGSVGEFDHKMLLQQYAGEPQAAALAPHLLGGEFKIVEAGKERRPVLEYVSQWDSEAEAADFFADYKKILRKKWQHCNVSTANETTVSGAGDNGYFVTRLTGNSVTSIEGLSDMNDWQRLKTPPSVQSAARVAFTAKAGGGLRASPSPSNRALGR
ncbi:MAG: hypothetical protein WB992_14585 [Bryobacteraceae bacterium]